MNQQKWDAIAGDYYENIISPIKNSQENPLLNDLKKMKGKNVIELGCGLGELLGFLSKNFKEVTAVDFSPKMIHEARKKNSQKNISFHVIDMSRLHSLNKKFDAAISVNSLLETNSKKLDESIQSIHHSIKQGGTFLAIVPAVESWIYEHQIRASRLQKKSDQKTVVFEPHGYSKIDFPNGVLTYEDGDQQKAFYHFEILHRLEKAGFEDVQISRVPYSWKEWSNAGFRNFSGENPPWDWYVKCRKGK